MDTGEDHQEAIDRLTILLAAEPRPGWEGIFEEIARREVERLALPAEENRTHTQHVEGRDG